MWARVRRTLMLVHVNGGSIARRLTIALPNARVRDVVVTDATQRATSVDRPEAATIVRPRSITICST